MPDSDTFSRLVGLQKPSSDVAQRIKARVMLQITPRALEEAKNLIVPSQDLALRVRRTILQRITETPSAFLADAARVITPTPNFAAFVRERVLAHLGIPEVSVGRTFIRFGAAFAALILMVRFVPIVLLTPTTLAVSGVELLPGGPIDVMIQGTWVTITTPMALHEPTMIRTGNASAKVLVHDDGVIRLGPGTTARVNVPRTAADPSDPTVTLVDGQLWVLGLIPPAFPGITVQGSQGVIDVHAGSISIFDHGDRFHVAAYDGGAIVQTEKGDHLLVLGERLKMRNNVVSFQRITQKSFAESWVQDNIMSDLGHRDDIARIQAERRAEMAGILPNSFLYPAKRIAEEVDVLFALSSKSRFEKRAQQATTRLSEALALIKEGDVTEANVSIAEYHSSLLALASGSGDNLVKFLLKKQLQEVTALRATSTPSQDLSIVRDAVAQVSGVLPNTGLEEADIEGYVLVDRLNDLNHLLTTRENVPGALAAYRELQPYLVSMLDPNAKVHPLLKKEAASLVANAAVLLKELKITTQSDTALIASIEENLQEFLPQDPVVPTVSEEELNQQVASMVERIFNLKMQRSRYNQLLIEMEQIKQSPHRGTLLRRLYRALPPNGLAHYVRAEIKDFGNELDGAR